MQTTMLINKVAGELNLKPAQVGSAIKLLFDEECTIPFVARYRKEMTGSLDEVELRAVRDRYHYLVELEGAKAKYLKVVEEHCQKNAAFHGKFDELKRRFEACTTRQELEDLYLPFKPKRRTRAMIAREKGLEPLLDRILSQRATLNDLTAAAQEFVTPATAPGATPVAPELVVATPEDALVGAADIFAERINETAEWRALVRAISQQTGVLVAKRIEDKSEKAPAQTAAEAAAAASVETAPPQGKGGGKGKGKGGEAGKYENYFDYKEPLASAPSHRIMAVRRGEAEKILRVSIEVDEERVLADLTSAVLGGEVATDPVKRWLSQVVEDSYRRLTGPSIETELRLLLKARAEDEAIQVFSKNLESLLLLPPIPGKTVLGVDPGIRTGSKLAVVDETGKLLAHATIHPDYGKPEHGKTKEAKATILDFMTKHKVQCLAVGNGTGSREIYRFIGGILKDAGLKDVKRVVVNEAGASVYSTDDIAREEFPDLDATIRSAVSIARRLQDPLAELVKISPRSIGVGQYQHDVNPGKLTKSLEEVVESCVNKVGVNLNTASHKLLSYVSGVGPALARSVVQWRDTHGKFPSRDKLLEVSGLGPKAFQQAAGFLRVPESPNPLDNSAVHPERYEIVQAIATDLKTPLGDLLGRKEVVEAVPWEKYVTQAVGLPTLKDIAAELIKPGRDPREDGSRLLFSDEVADLEDLKAGMILKGTVTNVTAFGAFVDIGVHQDGLVHVSELSEQFVKDPSHVVAVGAVVDVRVLAVDLQRRRISLSCRTQPRPQQGQAQGQQQSQQGQGGGGGGGGRGGGHRGQGASGGRPQGAQHGGSHQGGQGGQSRRPKEPEKSFTMDDLLNKFKRG
jgi:uncharacterized protein